MNLRFRLARTVSIQNVRFPFPILWHAHTGCHQLDAEVALKRCTAIDGTGLHIPAETLFSVTIEPGIEGSASGTLTLESFEIRISGMPEWQELHHAFRQRKTPFGRTLAQQMFTYPAYPWATSEVSSRIEVDSRRLRSRLFQEAYSFAATLRRCRMLRALLTALSDDVAESDRDGQFMPQCRYKVDSMFNAAFNTKLSTIELSRMWSTSRPRHCLTEQQRCMPSAFPGHVSSSETGLQRHW
ncbi:hypothetical protein [Paraburkholderia azotifigens]|uniref:Uncharacterized protein n=1 Tax=Paraburkholderia azotifigens TaxID=2057004 RepID=A0A5C6VND0_9BURK|nr:hypothetical protein [Paraburkholderia azotifigens]TXC84678.1 hypothetical protein FRZ40_31110 [Paraburkholderia azotifigens]